MAQPLAILDVGMVTGVGLSAPASCAAIRGAIDNFQETRFTDRGGEWILGCEVPLERPWRGRTRQVKMLAAALRECLDLLPDGIEAEDIPLILNLAERDRPGRLELSKSLYPKLSAELGVVFHHDSRILAQGRVGGAVALHLARRLLYREEEPHDHVVISGVDSFLVGPTLAIMEERERILTAGNSNGFIPGEAGAAVVVARPERAEDGALLCLGVGFAAENATIESEEPLRAEGLGQAIEGALAESGCDLADLDYRITDNNGEQYGFKEAALAISRVLRQRKEEFGIWHPADCIGEVGAATLPCMLGVALYSQRKGFAPGPGVLCHLSNDDGKRAALVLRRAGGQA